MPISRQSCGDQQNKQEKQKVKEQSPLSKNLSAWFFWFFFLLFILGLPGPLSPCSSSLAIFKLSELFESHRLSHFFFSLKGTAKAKTVPLIHDLRNSINGLRKQNSEGGMAGHITGKVYLTIHHP